MEQDTVDAVLKDYRTAPIDDRLRAILDFLHKLVLTPGEVETNDIRTLREAGLSDRAIYEAMYVAFAFNVIDRLADAFDFPVPPLKYRRRLARLLYRFGYETGTVIE